MEIIAHRGASFDAPENSLTAMRLAWQQEADAIELDLWLSRDGRLVVFHDATTKRFEKIPRKVSELTWSELQLLDIGVWKGAEFVGERIPSFESVLDTIPEKRRAVVEIKCGPEVIPAFARAFRESNRHPEQLCVICFDHDLLTRSKHALPDVEHYLLSNYARDAQTGRFPEISSLIAQATSAGFAGLDLQFTWPIDTALVNEIHAAGLKVLVWTVDDPDVARLLAEAGIDGLTTNRPGKLRSQLDSRST